MAGDLFRAQLVVISDALPEAALDSLKQFARDGKIVLVAMKDAATAKTIAQTGVEMEALTAVSVALLTIYDMCKAVDKEMVIGEIKLVRKTKK